MLVVDACVAIKWFRREPGTEKASAVLRSNQKLIAPDLIRIEVAAALTRFLRMGDLSDARVRTLLDKWGYAILMGSVSLEPIRSDFEEATEISCQVKHQLQDCLYVALAKRFNAPLVTSDEKLLKKAADMPCTMIDLTDFNA